MSKTVIKINKRKKASTKGYFRSLNKMLSTIIVGILRRFLQEVEKRDLQKLL